MKGGNFNKFGGQSCVLVAPLNWGLGHATRCIPLIKSLEALGCRVLLAATGSVASMLQQEFPSVKILSLPDYDIRYSRYKKLLPLQLFRQFPGIRATIKREHHWLQTAISAHGITAVISDNRPGLYSPLVPCVYITHQLHIATGSRWLSRLAQRLHYRYINRFSACWVPDAEGQPNLAGALSHPKKLPVAPVSYLGPLSRFNVQPSIEKKYAAVVILSGPEPQRTLLENILLPQLQQYNGATLLVRGLPGSTGHLPGTDMLSIVNHLPAADLAMVIQQAECIISRSGYTTVMDLVALQQKAVFIPTPGQTEQEYLAVYLQEQGLFTNASQQNFSLTDALSKATKLPAPKLYFNDTTLQTVLKNWLSSL